MGRDSWYVARNSNNEQRSSWIVDRESIPGGGRDAGRRPCLILQIFLDMEEMHGSPKVYIRDSGIAHSLLGLRTRDDVLAHPVTGPSWEGYAIQATAQR